MNDSPLARLSPELRNHVYCHVFVSDYAITLRSGQIQHALTRTCRQLRIETLGMFFALTRFNAHLDDGPATPLANWFRELGRNTCSLLHEVNIWDMHMLIGTLYGPATSSNILHTPPEDGKKYVLRPIGRQRSHQDGFLTDVLPALQALGLGVSQMCVVRQAGAALETSRFAIVPRSTLPTDTSFPQGSPVVAINHD